MGLFIEFYEKAIELEAKTIAFCAIGTGGKGLNQHEAAQCAVDTVLKYGKSFDKVCFNVFTDISEHAYRNRLSNMSLQPDDSETVKPIDPTAETKSDEPIINEPLIDC